MKKLLKNSQFALFLLLVATVIIFGIINPDILSAASLFVTGKNLCSSGNFCSCYYGDHDFR